MAGHSHWAGIKHKKALIDSKRGRLWSKLSKAIIVAARCGGSDPSMNLRLRYAINDAKAVSMPKDNIARAIKKGAGELDGAHFDEVVYEGYGPGGAAILCEVLTDNRNRTAPELRNLFERNGGKLGATGCVAWMFDRKGIIVIGKSGVDEDALMELALDAGADDLRTEPECFEVTCPVNNFAAVTAAVEEAGLTTEVCKIANLPKETVGLSSSDAKRVLKLVDLLDEHDDVQTVSSNFEIPDDLQAEI